MSVGCHSELSTFIVGDMAPSKGRNAELRKSKSNILVKFYNKYCNLNFLKALIFDPQWLPLISIGIVLTELVINVFVVHRVKYTEIDWIAYMQECEGFLNGTTNYSLLKGDTGPLVYPAGFVYIYSAFYFLTSYGKNIKLAQYVFIGIYILQMMLVLRLYSKSQKVPPYVLVISAFTSYRIHSIYILRLFNDPIAILFLYAALNLFLDQKWNLGSIFFSLGVSVKMNILLFAPAVLLLYITSLGYVKTVKQLAICAVVQLVLGAPFLFTYPIEYIKGSFDLGRIFEHKWTVNYRFLSRTMFENKIFHISLLILHILLLILFASPCYRYFQNYCRLRALQKQLQPQLDRRNAEVKKNKLKKDKQKQKTTEEKLTKDQQNFLDSFEKSLQKNAQSQQNESNMVQQPKETEVEKYSIDFDRCTQLAILPLFLSNFIGVICARSLHYQFYVWYFHTLPYLTWYTDFSVPFKFLILGAIEFCWNTYPSTDFSSAMLHLTHLVLLIGIARKLFKTNVKVVEKSV